MDIELWDGASKAIIDPRGAWLTNLSDDQGDILFPRRSLKTATGETKLRGGCHVCLPNFGPGGESDQSQHGFGRDMGWTVSDRTDSSVLLELDRGKGDYEKMSAELSYQLSEYALMVTLDVTNGDERDLRIAPAFHPYFMILGTGDVLINGKKQSLDDIAEAQFISGQEQQLHLPGRSFTLYSQQLPTWAMWTDQLGSYICVEPSVGGFTFLNDQPAPEEVLRPDETKTYILKMQWR
jgi:D-hexose-6-phosphate mutarotase